MDIDPSKSQSLMESSIGVLIPPEIKDEPVDDGFFYEEGRQRSINLVDNPTTTTTMDTLVDNTDQVTTIKIEETEIGDIDQNVPSSYAIPFVSEGNELSSYCSTRIYKIKLEPNDLTMGKGQIDFCPEASTVCGHCDKDFDNNEYLQEHLNLFHVRHVELIERGKNLYDSSRETETAAAGSSNNIQNSGLEFQLPDPVSNKKKSDRPSKKTKNLQGPTVAVVTVDEIAPSPQKPKKRLFEKVQEKKVDVAETHPFKINKDAQDAIQCIQDQIIASEKKEIELKELINQLQEQMGKLAENNSNLSSQLTELSNENESLVLNHNEVIQEKIILRQQFEQFVKDSSEEKDRLNSINSELMMEISSKKENFEVIQGKIEELKKYSELMEIKVSEMNDKYDETHDENMKLEKALNDLRDEKDKEIKHLILEGEKQKEIIDGLLQNQKIEESEEQILNVIFKMLPFEEVKKFRLVSSAWNQVGTSELSKRHQKPIKFHDSFDIEKLNALVQLQRRHNEVFPCDQRHQIFTNFSMSMSFVMSPEIDQFLENFSPKYIELFNPLYYYEVLELSKFLVKISPTVQKIKYNLNEMFEDKDEEIEIRIGQVVQELTSTPFPNLRKISQKFSAMHSRLIHFLFYPLIGQNSPKLHHLELGSFGSKRSKKYIKKQYEQAGLMSKLQILKLVDVNNYFENLEIFTEFGTNGVLKLTKLKIKQDNFYSVERIRKACVPFIASQAETLRVLEISSTRTFLFDRPSSSILRVPFPTLQNLSILKIDFFSASPKSEPYFEPINFSVQFPKLVEIRTRDIETFLTKKLGHGGDSVKSVILLRNPSDKRKKPDCFDDKKELDLDSLYQIFPNLGFLELDVFNFYPSEPFQPQLKKVVIHCELKDLLHFHRKLQDAKKVEILVDCENKLVDEASYKDYLGRGLFWREDHYYDRNYYYTRYLKIFSECYAHLDSVAITFIGYNISEDFKRDFRAILPDCAFICSPLMSC